MPDVPAAVPSPHATAEAVRLHEDATRAKNWKRWGPYLAERQWATVREDYSPNGTCWDYFPHDHARSRAYRWGEDGLLGIADRECRLCLALGLWNGQDPILKERLFGLTGDEGNHGEDVKECYYYLDSTPTHSYLKALYKYPQRAFPYADLVATNRARSRQEGEYELIDTGIFAQNRYFDVQVEYAKQAPDDICLRITIANRGPDSATVHLLPTLWFRNTWSWGSGEPIVGVHPDEHRPFLHPDIDASQGGIQAHHATLGTMCWRAGTASDGSAPALLFTDNDTNLHRLYGVPNPHPYCKDAFHRYLIEGDATACNPSGHGTKVAAHYRLTIPAGGTVTIPVRLWAAAPGQGSSPGWLGADLDAVIDARRQDADQYFARLLPRDLTPDQRLVARQAYAGLLWTKQYYHYVVSQWLEGDPGQPRPPAERLHGRNADWKHLYSRDVISMPDGWEYPWFAAWDLAFHMVPFARLDPGFAKEQLLLFLREWYMHPNGQIPAYEFAFGDVNPPVHAWAAWRVYRMTGSAGHYDTAFLERVFQKLLLNFTWWVNRKDVAGKHLFAGGFLGLDNIGLFDRSKPLPHGGSIEQADGTAWMAFYAARMLSMALELAKTNCVYEDIASKFFEHFIEIADAMNTLGGTGLWDEEDGFYYDQLMLDGHSTPMRVRSAVGLIPLFAVEILDQNVVDQFPGFAKRMAWFTENRPDLARIISYVTSRKDGADGRRLLAIPSPERLRRVLERVLDEDEFLSPHGIRSVSRVHAEHPFQLTIDGQEYGIGYEPGESRSGLFGGNSNWRGPVWFPINYLMIECLERYHAFYGDSFTIACPTRSGRMLHLGQVAHELSARLSGLFLAGPEGARPCHGTDARYRDDPHWRDLVLFYEYFHGDTGQGLGASHQTGWTALAAMCIERLPRG